MRWHTKEKGGLKWNTNSTPIESFIGLSVDFDNDFMISGTPKSWAKFQEFASDFDYLAFSNTNFPDVEFKLNNVWLFDSIPSKMTGDQIVSNQPLGSKDVKCKTLCYQGVPGDRLPDKIPTVEDLEMFDGKYKDCWNNYGKLSALRFYNCKIDSLKGINNVSCKEIIFNKVEIMKGLPYLLLVRGLQEVFVQDSPNIEPYIDIVNKYLKEGKTGYFAVLSLFNAMASGNIELATLD